MSSAGEGDGAVGCGCLSPGLGVALAGGGGRGLAQIGVLKVLEEQAVPIEFVAGTSIGALLGGLYALEGSAGAVEERVAKLLEGDEAGPPPAVVRKFRALARRDPRDPDIPVLDRLRRYWVLGQGLVRPSLADGSEIRELLEELFGDATFADTRIPLAVTSVDLDSGRRMIFASGDLVRAVYASMALPGLLPPLELDGLRLADGAFAEPVPVDTCRQLGAGNVLAVDVLGRPPESLPLRTSLEVVMRADEVARYALERENLLKADLIVTPEVDASDWADFSRPAERIAVGERAARTQLPAIRDLVERFESMFVRAAPDESAGRAECGCRAASRAS
jgi:NTE family protein